MPRNNRQIALVRQATGIISWTAAANFYYSLPYQIRLDIANLGRSAIRRLYHETVNRGSQALQGITQSIETSFPGAPPPMPREIKSGYGNAAKPEDAQFVSVVRHHSSTFGKRKRYTIKKIKHELRESDILLKSRFQTFQDNGFQNGLGGRNLNLAVPILDAQAGAFPFHIWDVTSLASGVESSFLSAALPVRGYQLMFNTTNASAKEYVRYGWLPMDHAQNSVGVNFPLTAGNMGNSNIAINVEKTGELGNTLTFPSSTMKAPYASGFKHDWSDIRLILYPQEDLPVKWHIALISFPDNLVNNETTTNDQLILSSAGPPQTYYYNSTDTNDRTATTYDARRTTNGAGHDNLDYRWQKFWSGRLQNPINRDEAGVGTLNPSDASLPFKIIEHEAFYQPARDNPSFGGTAQRLIKKLFYRRGWQFPPSSGIAQQELNGDAMMNLDTVQLHNTQSLVRTSSPFPSQSEAVYLAIWCESYKTRSGTAYTMTEYKDQAFENLTNGSFPSYDLVVRMKHTLTLKENSTPTGIVPVADNPTAP